MQFVSTMCCINYSVVVNISVLIYLKCVNGVMFSQCLSNLYLEMEMHNPYHVSMVENNTLILLIYTQETVKTSNASHLILFTIGHV